MNDSLGEENTKASGKSVSLHALAAKHGPMTKGKEQEGLSVPFFLALMLSMSVLFFLNVFDVCFIFKCFRCMFIFNVFDVCFIIF